MNTIFLQ